MDEQSKNISSRINFSIAPVSEITELNPTISKARVRIFYTGLNRNLTFITEEFAEKLLATLPYTPVGGLWSDITEDFSDHGGPSTEDREKFMTFGVVPENPNVQWENHMDQDGVLRQYACCDVILWTARYKAAREIPKKAQSMELFVDSVQGEWKRDGSVQYFEFTDGRFFGLTALGEDVEPCFEGAAFYNFDESSQEFLRELKNYTLSAKNELIGGEEQMDEKKKDTPVVEEAKVTETETEEVTTEEEATETEEVVTEGAETVEETTETEEVIETTEEPAEETTEEAEDTTAAEATETVVEEEVVEETTEETDPVVESPEFTAEQFELLNQRIAELEAENETIKAQNAELLAYQNANETTKKAELLEKYSLLISEEENKNFTDKMNDYSFDELEKEVSYCVLKNNESKLFSKSETEVTVTDVDETAGWSAAAKLMAKYNKD